MARHGVGLLALTGALLCAAPSRADDARFEAAECLLAAAELIAGGAALDEELFARGWPTSPDYRAVTRDLAGQGVDAVVMAYLGSGCGLPLGSTSYQRARLERAPGGMPSPVALVRAELAAYRNAAGATSLTLPGTFEPVGVPFQRGKAELERAWSPDDLGTWRWREGAPPRHTLDALAFALLAETRFARAKLAHTRVEDQGGGRKATLLGRTGPEGFFGLVALHAAFAKLVELPRLVVDARAQKIMPANELGRLDELRYHLPTAWTTEVGAAGLEHAAVDDETRGKTYLFGQAGLLLALAELADLCYAGPRPARDLLVAARGPTPGQLVAFEAGLAEQALDAALFVSRSLRTLHVNVVQGRAMSVGSLELGVRGNTISPRDVGLYLLALDAFRALKLPDKHPRTAELTDEQRKADTLIRSLGASIRAWESDEPGLYDMYSVADNGRQAPTKSVGAQGLAVRGLLVAHRHAGQQGDDAPFFAAAERSLRWLDRERWDRSTRAYANAETKGKVAVLDAVAVLGALRAMALETGDGRYLMRYQQYLSSLGAGGLLRPGQDRRAPGLAAEVALRSGSK